MPNWGNLIKHGVTLLRDHNEIAERYAIVTGALDELLKEIAEGCSYPGPALERAVALRSRSPGETAGTFFPSRYEGLNQLIHYAYCLIAAQRLDATGCTEIKIIPCGHEAGEGADVEALTAAGERVAGEVFCVSPTLLPTKRSNAFKALDRRPEAKVKFILFNVEAGGGAVYRPKRTGIGLFTVDRAEQHVSFLAFRDTNGLQEGFQLHLAEGINMNR